MPKPIPESCLKAVSAMLANKKVRMSAEGVRFWFPEGRHAGDVWFYIQAVRCDNKLDLCSTGHLCLSGVKLSHVIL